MKKLYVVNFTTESGDRWTEIFKGKPTDGHLSAYVKENFEWEFTESGERLIYWDKPEEVKGIDLPEPTEPIPSI